MMKTLIYLPLGLLVFMYGCGTSAEEMPEEVSAVAKAEGALLLKPNQQRAAGIVLEPLEEKSAWQTVKANGMFDVPAQYTASVTTFVGSFVRSADKHIGEKVVKGQVLATMEGPEFIALQQQYLENKSLLALLQADFDRQSNLYADSITSKKAFERAKADYDRTKSLTESLRQTLQYTRINFTTLDSGIISRTFSVVAPISGYLTEVNARIGAYAAPGESLMEIVDLSHLHVELAVYETDAMKIKEGQKMRIWLPSEETTVYEAEIYLIDKEFDRESRTVMVHGHFEEDQPFIVGMFVEGEIVVRENRGMTVPASAAVFSDQQRYVFLAKKTEQGTLFRAVPLKEEAESGGMLLLPAHSVPAGYDMAVTKGAGYLLGEWMREE